METVCFKVFKDTIALLVKFWSFLLPIILISKQYITHLNFFFSRPLECLFTHKKFLQWYLCNLSKFLPQFLLLCHLFDLLLFLITLPNAALSSSKCTLFILFMDCGRVKIIFFFSFCGIPPRMEVIILKPFVDRAAVGKKSYFCSLIDVWGPRYLWWERRKEWNGQTNFLTNLLGLGFSSVESHTRLMTLQNCISRGFPIVFYCFPHFKYIKVSRE